MPLEVCKIFLIKSFIKLCNINKNIRLEKMIALFVNVTKFYVEYGLKFLWVYVVDKLILNWCQTLNKVVSTDVKNIDGEWFFVVCICNFGARFLLGIDG